MEKEFDRIEVTNYSLLKPELAKENMADKIRKAKIELMQKYPGCEIVIEETEKGITVIAKPKEKINSDDDNQR